METFGERLRRIRRERGIGQRALAAHVGKSKTWLIHLETGQRWAGKLPPLDDVRLLARALEVGVDELVGDDDAAQTVRQIAESPAWYATASDEALMARAGITPVPPEIAAYVEAVWRHGGEFGLHAGANGTVNPQDLEDKFGRPLRYQTEQGDPLHWTRVFGQCMEPRISDGDLIFIDRDTPLEPGVFVAAILHGEQAVARRLAKVNGRFWLETLDGKAPTLVTDGVRIIGRIRYRQSAYM